MKKINVLLVLLFIVFGSQAKSPVTKNYVISNGETYFCEKVIPGPANTRIYNAAGEVIKIPCQLIESFKQDDEVFVKLPVISKSNDTIGLAFMQYISSRAGMQLFRYCSRCLQYDPLEGVIAPVNPVFRYYVFKGGKFFDLLDEDNLESYLSFFNVRIIC
jgi:hypothetical protein